MVTKKKDAKETLPILEVRDLHTYFYTADGVVKAVDGVNLDVFPQRTLGIVGESGCGKSITTKSILRLIDNPGKILDGTMTLYDKDHENPQDIATLNNTELKKVRGGRIRSDYSIGDGFGEVIEAEIQLESPICNKNINEIDLPKGIRIGSIFRNEKIIIPNSKTIFHENDDVVFFAETKCIKTLEKILSIKH